ncbi:hypothetical protein TRIUR3_31676 [Triticum urartu]|uniref:Uncharacterized protein n=1 Tax=Triticum urartu TaxID=4572 RepID=M7Z855_TRIUA|nr:hypothetical protein TRIUR3_31676 [Triticum urartu]
MCWLAGSTVSWCVRTLSLHAACTSRHLREIVREPHPLVTAPHKPYPFQLSQIDAAASLLPLFLPPTRRPPPPAIPRPRCRHGLFKRHAPPWCEAGDQDPDEEEEIRAPQRWIDRCEVTTSSSGRGGAARLEIQSAHAPRGRGDAGNRGKGHQGRSCSAPVPKPPPGSLPPPSSRISPISTDTRRAGTEARFSGGSGNLQAESDPIDPSLQERRKERRQAMEMG